LININIKRGAAGAPFLMGCRTKKCLKYQKWSTESKMGLQNEKWVYRMKNGFTE
jgi:hypothetical protein